MCMYECQYLNFNLLFKTWLSVQVQEKDEKIHIHIRTYPYNTLKVLKYILTAL